MGRKRLTREGRRGRTTERLIAAARKLIAKRGLSATTLEDIADEAGYTRGAFYSNFSSKIDLFFELLCRDHATTSAQLRAMRDDTLQGEQLQRRLGELYGQVYRSNESFMIWTEARLLAARDAKLRVKFDRLFIERHLEVTGLIEYLCGRGDMTPMTDPTVAAMGLNSLFAGLRLATLSSPVGRVSPDGEVVLSFFACSLMNTADRNRTE